MDIKFNKTKDENKLLVYELNRRLNEIKKGGGEKKIASHHAKGNKVVSGPFHLKFREVPTPLWGPFGMFPQPKEKASGIVMPVYGEEARRGFFLRDGGYYFAISDYMDLRLTGDIYSRGGHALNFNQNYIKRYAYQGTFNFSYTKNVLGTLVNAGETNAYWVRWNHTPQSRGNSRFSASVSAGSTSYNANNNLIINDYQRSITSQFSSNVSYSTKFQGTPYSLTANLRHSQNIQTQIVNLTLPEMTLNMTRIYPFKGLTKNSNSPIAKLNLSHTFSAKNELTNAPRGSFGFDVANEYDDAQDTLQFNGANFNRILDRSRLGAKHGVPISTSLNVLKYFTLSPSFSYDEVWYNRDNDSFLELHERADLANKKAADLFISIHCNAFDNPAVFGTESYVMGLDKVNKNLDVAKRENSVMLLEKDQAKYEGFEPGSDESYILFNLYQSAHLNNSLLLAAEIEKQMKERVGRNSRGVRQAPFWVLWQTTMPSVLVETGYLSNSKEEKELNDKLNQVYIASGIYRAVRAYKEKMESSN